MDQQTDLEPLVELWRRSVAASHDFLAPGDVEAIEAEVRCALPAVPELWLAEADGRPAGFLGATGPHVDMLFVAPEFFGRGVGTALLRHARALHGPLATEVNEANHKARAFYLSRGFAPTGRSPVDSQGRPYAILQLRQAATAREARP